VRVHEALVNHPGVFKVQYGLGERAKKNPNTGESIAGPVTLSDEELAKNRIDPYIQTKTHPLDDEWHRQRSADLSKITTPFLSCANWGGQGIHPRGNFNGFTEAPARQKWLEVHGDTHWTQFYTAYGRSLQKRFFDYFLKGMDNGWDKEPRVQLNIRYPGEKFVLRMENEWPLARTQWTKFYLDPARMALSREPAAQAGKVEYEAFGKGLTFSTPPLEQDTEITGPIAAKLFISSSTKDADLFLIVRVFNPNNKELTFQGALDPNTPIAQGWLRASHRRIDPKRSKPYQPFHLHERVELLTPGEVYECDVEVLPTCVAIPAGWKVALTVCSKDYEYEGNVDKFGQEFYYATRGTGGMTHNDPDDRPPEIFGGKVTLYAGGDKPAYLLLPIVPD
jgi:predicted acyl esterase